MAKKEDADEVITRLPSPRILKSLLRQEQEARGKRENISTDYGQSVKDASEKHNLHVQAFKLIARLRRMDPVKLLGFLDHFDDYRAKIKLDDLKATSLGLEEPEGEEEVEKENDKGNVTKFPPTVASA